MKKSITLEEFVEGLNDLLEDKPIVMSALALTGYPDPSTMQSEEADLEQLESWSYGYAYNMIGVMCSLFMDNEDDELPIIIATDSNGIITKFFLNSNITYSDEAEIELEIEEEKDGYIN